MAGQNEFEWILEDADEYGESHVVLGEINDRSITAALETCFASLFDNDDESRIIAMGELDRRVVEIQVFGHGDSIHYVLATPRVEPKPVTLMVGRETTLDVLANEVLTKRQAVSAFLSFRKSKTVPPEFDLVAKTYYWTGT